LATHGPRWTAAGIAYYAAPDVPWSGGGGSGGAFNGVHTLATGGQALTVPKKGTNGTQLTTAALVGSNSQKWNFTEQSDGSYTLVNVASGLCVDVSGGSMSAGASVIQWTCSGGTNQRWTVTPVTGGHTLTSAKSGLVITTASTANNAPVTQQPASGSALQRWTIG
ncbi:RICIN domain-containing protein, partial [Streptomyces sp. NPDC059352]|uniref:RICIN domain-containing protein n=1 Tax=Streptomyces sp. NPDC059352 TaxID=3346810 RepID=UPI0036CEDEED